MAAQVVRAEDLDTQPGITGQEQPWGGTGKPGQEPR